MKNKGSPVEGDDGNEKETQKREDKNAPSEVPTTKRLVEDGPGVEKGKKKMPSEQGKVEKESTVPAD